MFEEAYKIISQYDTIIIHRHSRPDGDAMGSQIGLKHIIKENFPDKTVYTVGDDAKRFSFMDDSKMDVLNDEAYENALAIILDTSSPNLISDSRYTKAKATLRFDHHIFIEKIADVEVVDTSFESCCSLIADFAIKQNLTVSLIAAKSLYTGLTTDSGRFRYDSTNKKTFEIASFLLGCGVAVNDIYPSLYSDDFDKILLRAKFIMKIKFTLHNVAYIYTTSQEASELNVDVFTISRGMVSTMADIKGVDIWVNFTESDGSVLCEIRSSKYNINPIATAYGGGGHAKASGATLKDKETAMSLLNDLDAMVENS